MPKPLKIFLFGVALILGVTLLIALLLPDKWDAGATIDINAEPAAVHEYVASFHGWQKWATTSMSSEDPTAVVEISEDGRTMSWTGEKMGTGSMTITRVEPGRGMWYEGTVRDNSVKTRGWITYEEVNGLTRVTWRDEGDLTPLIGGFFAAMVNQALDAHFAKSLAALKAELEPDGESHENAQDE